MKTLLGEDPRATSRLTSGSHARCRHLGVLFVLAVTATPAQAIPLPGGSLDPSAVPKYRNALVIPPAMPLTGEVKAKAGGDGEGGLLQDRRAAV